MKKYYLSLLTILSLCSCQMMPRSEVVITSDTASSVVDESSFSSPIEDNRMYVLKSPDKTVYSLYESYDFTGLMIVDSNQKEIDGYHLSLYENGEEIKEGNPVLIPDFDGEGSYTILVEKDGYQATSFNIYVIESTNLSSKLMITSLPKTKYYAGDTFDPDGLTVVLNSSYVDADNKKQSRNDVLTSYSLKFGRFDATKYVFNNFGVYSITVTAKTLDNKDISTSFSVFVKGENTSPVEYEDDTFNYVENKREMNISFDNINSNTTGDDNVYTPDEVTVYPTMSYFARNNAYNWRYTPSKGKVPILVIPTIIPGYSSLATESNHQLITKAFFGKSEDLYFESLHSYYYQASYGQLDFTGSVTPFFDLANYSSKYTSSTSDSNYDSAEIATLASKWASEVGYDLTEYDSNNDGCIDAVYIVYLSTKTDYSNWWAYCSTTSTVGSIEEPKPNSYMWAGLNFLNGKFAGYTGPNSTCDAHVLIHESGHMLGLSDYYSYNSGSSYDALGNTDMMDRNSGDQNPYSKILLGWTTPYVVYGKADFTILDSQSMDQFVVFSEDNKQYRVDSDGKIIFNPFSEFMVFDYYTNENLNSMGYDVYNSTPIQEIGGRLYHVDSRLFAYSRNGYNLINEDNITSSLYSGNLIRVISNSEGGDRAESIYGYSHDNYDEIRLISADKRYMSSNNPANLNTLFRKGITDKFDFAEWQDSFPNKTKFDNEKDCSYSFEINY